MTHGTAQTLFLGVLATVALFTALRLGQALFAPLATGLVLGIVCAPLADLLARAGLPRALASLLVLAFLVLLMVALFFAIGPAINDAVQSGPEIWHEVTFLLKGLRDTIAGAENLKDTVSEALSDAPPAIGGEDEDAVSIPGVFDALALAPSLAAMLLIFAGAFYFFLLSRASLYAQIEASLVPWDRRMLAQAELRVSRYFLTITLINASFGVLVWLAMTLVGLPQPVLWGLAAFLFNFVLYLGPAALAVAFLVAGILAFDGAMSVVPAVLYVSMNMTEGQFVTPALVGRQMEVNPLLVFISLVFWLWLWGPIGGIVAIPVLVWTLYLLGRLDWDTEETPAPPPVTGLR
ncbi:MAG: AI-2E family transporter [Roseicyclus sp.]